MFSLADNSVRIKNDQQECDKTANQDLMRSPVYQRLCRFCTVIHHGLSCALSDHLNPHLVLLDNTVGIRQTVNGKRGRRGRVKSYPFYHWVEHESSLTGCYCFLMLRESVTRQRAAECFALCVCVFLEKAALGEDFQDSGERFGRSSQS